MIRLGFFGAAGEVTGSCYLLTTDRARVLFDFGMHQGDSTAEARNRAMPPIDPGNLDAVVLTHGHLDHVGRMPMLAKNGYRGPIYTTPASAEIGAIILKDAAYLQSIDAERENRYRTGLSEPAATPLYTAQDVERVLPLLSLIGYNDPREVAPGITVRFIDAGHILGSASLLVDARHGPSMSATTTIAFSGDVGVTGSPILMDPTTPAPADFAVIESTYGDRDHRPLAETKAELLRVLQEAQSDCGVVLIPAFAVGRTQDLLYHIGGFVRAGSIRHLDVVVDSPMATEVSNLYRTHTELYDTPAQRLLGDGLSPLEFPGLRFTRTREDSAALNNAKHCTVIISASGMCTGGRIVHHLRHHLPKPTTHVVIVGYQAQGTLGRRLVDGAKQVRILGESVTVNAKLHTLGGFSAHAGQTGLVAWARPLAGSVRRAFLTHGEDRPRAILRDNLRPILGFPPELPMYGDTVSLA